MKQYEASARTVEEAIELGLQELGVSIGDVDVRVVEEGSKGLFGLFGSRMAKVCLTVKASEEDPLGNLLEEKKPAKKPAEKPAEKKEAAKKPAEKKEAAKKPVPKQEKKEKPAEKPAAEKAEPAENPEPRTLEKPEVTMIAAENLDPESPAGIAKAFLGELTKLMGVDVTIDMGTDAEGNVYGFINGDTLGILIGRRGETLDALQYLTSLKVNRGRDSYTRVTLDTENYRAKREDTRGCDHPFRRRRTEPPCGDYPQEITEANDLCWILTCSAMTRRKSGRISGKSSRTRSCRWWTRSSVLTGNTGTPSSRQMPCGTGARWSPRRSAC